MYISFPRKIRGRKDLLSISIPKSLCEDYDLQPGDYISVTLENKPKDPELRVQFNKKIAAVGSEGRILYLPKDIVERHHLQRNTSVLVTLEEA